MQRATCRELFLWTLYERIRCNKISTNTLSECIFFNIHIYIFFFSLIFSLFSSFMCHSTSSLKHAAVSMTFHLAVLRPGGCGTYWAVLVLHGRMICQASPHGCHHSGGLTRVLQDIPSTDGATDSRRRWVFRVVAFLRHTAACPGRSVGPVSLTKRAPPRQSALISLSLCVVLNTF